MGRQKKSKFNINPVYSEGLRLRQSVPGAQQRYYDAVSTPVNTGMFNTVTSDYAPQLTYGEELNMYPSVDEQGELVETQNNDNEPITNVNDEGGFFDRLKTSFENPKDPWRMFWERKYESQKSSEENALFDVTSEQKNLQIAQDYLNNIKRYDELNKLLQDPNVDRNTKSKLINELDITRSKIKETDDYIKQNWKKSDVFMNLFTDMSDMGFFEQLKYKSNGDLYTLDKSGTIIGNLNNAANSVMSTLSSVKNAVKNAGLEVYNLFGKDKWALTRSMLKNSVNDEYDKSKFFDSVTKHLNNPQEYVKYKQQDLDNAVKEYDRLFDERSAQLVRTTNITKNGNWLFNPQKINKHFKELQEGEASGSLFTIWDPSRWAYATPEMGSSFADLQTFVELATADRIAAGLSNAAEYVAGPSGKAKALSGILKFLAFGSEAAGLYLSTKSREVETRAEVSDAYTQRIVEQLYSNKNINAGKVLESIDNFINNNSGLDKNAAANLDIEDKLRLALAYNINTEDPEFEKIKQQSRNGLAKIYNDNETLSTLDYIQAMPYMSYFGKTLKGALTGGTNQIEKRLIDQTVKKGSSQISRAATAMSDSIINKVFNKNASNLYKKVMASHASKWLGNQAKLLLRTGFLEGIEEGQQQLLQSRYMKGEYDDYDTPYSMFNLPSVFSDASLASDAIASYIGINFGDPDNGDAELRKAMNIGSVTGAMFHGAHQINPIVNLLTSNDPNTLRYVASQLKNDHILKRIVGENYGKAEDDAHIKIFNAHLDNGGDPFKLTKSLQEMKRFKGDQVSDEFINDDIKLLNALNFVKNNENFKGILKELNITDENDKLATIQNAVRAIVDDSTLNNLLKDQQNKLLGIREDFRAIVGMYTDPNFDERNIPDHLKTQYDIYKPVVQKLKSLYKQYVAAETERNNLIESKNRSDASIAEQAKKNIDYDKKKKALTDSGEKDTSSLDKELEDEITNIINKKKKSITSESDFINNRIDLLYKMKRLDVMKKTRKMFYDRQTLLKHLNEEIGIDANVDRLASIVDNMNDEIESYQKQLKDAFKEADAQIDEHNKQVDAYNKKAKEYNYKHRRDKGFVRQELMQHRKYALDQFRDELKGSTGNMFDEFEKLSQIFFINKSLKEIYNPYIASYAMGYVNPSNVLNQTRNLKWSELSNEQQKAFTDSITQEWKDKGLDLSKLTKSKIIYEYRQRYGKISNSLYNRIAEFKSKRKAYLSKNEQDRTIEEQIALEKEWNELNRDAAKQLIQQDLQKKKDRQRIAHREFLRDGGLTNDDIQNAESGDEKAKESVEVAISDNDEQLNEDKRNKEQNVDNNDINEAPTTVEPEVQVTEIEDTDESDLYQPDPDEAQMVDELLKDKKPNRKKVVTSTNESDKPGVSINEQKDTSVIGNIPADGQQTQPVQPSNVISDDDQGTVTAQPSQEEIIKQSLQNILKGEYTVEDVLQLSEGTYNEDILSIYVKKDKKSNTVAIVIKNDQGVTMPIKIPIGYVPNEEIKDNEEIWAFMTNGKDSFVVTDSKRAIQLIKPGVSVDNNTDMNSENNTKNKPINDDNDSVEDTDDTDNTDDENDAESDTKSTLETTQSEKEKQIESVDKDKKPETIQIENLQDDIDNNTAEIIEIEQDTLEAIDNDFYTYDDLYPEIICGDDSYYTNPNYSLAPNKDAVERDFISQTFFYQNSRYNKKGEEYGPVRITVRGKDVSFKYPIQEGYKLAQKLTQKGWFESTQKFYIVHGNDEKYQFNPQAYSISLVIYDNNEKKTYIASMRTPAIYSYIDKRGVELEHNGERELFDKLSKIGVDQDKYEEKLNEIIISRFKEQFSNEQLSYQKDSEIKTKAYGWFQGLDVSEKRRIQNVARKYASNGKAMPLSTEEITKNIEELKKRRLEIIKAYCDKVDNKYVIPSEIKETVTPNNPRISNGSINTYERDKSGMPVFKPLIGDDRGFGILNTTDEIEEQLKSGNIQFGFGKGMFGEPAYGITSFDGSKQFIGKGFAGKIYFIYKTNNGQEVPLMLREQKFNRRTINGKNVPINRNDITLAINPKTGEVNGKPTVAEVLFYMLTNKLNEKYYPNNNASDEIRKAFIDFFIHNGEKTTSTTKNTTRALNRFKYYADKQLSWDLNENTNQYELTIVLPDKNGNRVQRHFSANDLFAGTEQSNDLIKDIIYHISKNIHWNTDIDAMSSKIDYNIMKQLGQFFEDTGLDKFSFLDLDELSFNKEDLFTEENGKLIPKDISVLAWMLKTGKLMSDVAPQVFKDPFIYATGVSQQSPAKRATDSLKTTPASKTNGVIEQKKIDKQKKEKFDKFNKEKIDNLSKKFRKLAPNFQVLLSDSIDQANKTLELANTNNIAQQHGGLSDRIMLDYKPNTGANIKKEIEDKVREFAKNTNYDIKDIDMQSLDQFSDNQLRINLVKTHIPYVWLYKDGHVRVSLNTITNIQSTIQTARNKKINNANAVTGVFSEEGGGTLNVRKARAFLNEVLGLSEDKVFITNGIIASFDNREAYGCVTASSDAITEAIIGLSTQAGSGVEYHEAWHYVNLLLHNDITRNLIYREYVKLHKGSEKLTFRQIEELLADEFKNYVQLQRGTGLRAVIKRAFNRIYDFVTFNYRNRRLINSVFKSINNGGYKGNRIDPKSMEEFKRAYGGIVEQSKYQIPGVNQKSIDSLQYVDTYHKFYQVCESLANKMLDYYAITRPEDMKRLSGSKFQQFIEELKANADETTQGVIEDIDNNKDAFFNIVKQTFKQYGIDAKIKKLKQLKKDLTEDEENALKEDEKARESDTGDRADNTWDVFQFEVSKKDNVANRAKLFLTHLPKARLEVSDEDSSEKNVVYETDDLLNTPLYMPFGEVWTKILKDLWDVESYSEKDKDGNYLPSSLRGKVENRAKNEAFYRILNDKLSELDGDVYLEIDPDIEMQNQIYSTIKSQQAQMAQIWLEDPKAKFVTSSQMYEDLQGDLGDEYKSQDSNNEDIDDVDRAFNIINDNALRARRSLPREWSNAVMLSGLINNNNGSTVINKKFVEHVSNSYQKLLEIVTESTKRRVNHNYPTTPEAYAAANETLINGLNSLLNYLCIPSDESVIENLIAKYVENGKVGNDVLVFKALQNIIKNTKDKGGLAIIVKTLKDSINKPNLIVGKGKVKDISKIYMGTKEDSFICELADSYNSVHPSSSDFSVKGPDGSMHYPISQNNHMSDEIRRLNTDKQHVLSMMRSPFAKHSILLQTALDIDPNAGSQQQFRLNAFIGMKDTRNQKGQDYFGITNLEDYLAKMTMTFNDMLTLPTMADKKTWYAIQQKLISLPKDLITYDIESESGAYKIRRFSNNTLNIFKGYYLDEIESLKQYYSRENIEYLRTHPNARIKNFHGKFKNNRMDFSGNGGLFRYMYGLDKSHGCNLNQWLEAQYNLQKRIEQNPEQYGGLSKIRENDNDLDGFELVRKAISEIEEQYKNTDKLYDDINRLLFERVDSDLKILTANTDYRLGFMDGDKFVPDAIPSFILKRYQDLFAKAGEAVGRKPYSDKRMLSNYGLSAVANHVISTWISIVELEKVFSGDPANYKYAYYSNGKTPITEKIEVPYTVDGKTNTYTIDVRILKEKDSDKIKRLGALLSPGQNVRSDYGEDITNIPKFKSLKGDKYSVMNICDFEAKSLFIEEASENFKRQSAINVLRSVDTEWLNDYIKKNGFKDKQDFFIQMYKNYDVYRRFSNEKNHDKKYRDTVKIFFDAVNQVADMQCGPYEKITVGDAEVIIRPELYRKVRMGIGRWSVEEDETGYSDEKAYQILEKDGSWMSDPEKASIVSKLELFPLKMSYFQNSEYVISENNVVNLPIYDKMAIFPMFKYMTRSKTGKALYDRMNDSEKGCIDMIAFESAVKVGDNQNKYSPYDISDENLSNFNFDDLNEYSDKKLDENNNVINTNFEKSLPIKIQSLNGLRMQLNTDAHKHLERGIGTQMFKIAFSNILDNMMYGIGKTDSNGNPVKLRNGNNIKHDIMSCIFALTEMGENNVMNEFKFKNGIADRKQVENLIRRVVENNGLGIPAKDIIDNYGCAASLTSRRVFEQSVSALVNGEVVKINTNGGTAVQQSIFGLIGYDSDNEAIRGWTKDGFRNYNNGDELKWQAKNNTMEVLLSINHFRAMLPEELQNAPYEVRRQWLVDHDLIKGIKSEKYWDLTDEQKQLKSILDKKVEELDFSVRLLNILKTHDVVNVKDLIDKHDEYKKYLGKKLSEEISDFLDNLNLDFNTDTEIKANVVHSNPEATGIGYRIPTQGMSSMFAFIAADVLPETSGDLIIVPREFTAQTGSDFDIDKLFIAMKSYTDGVQDNLTAEQLDKLQHIYANKEIKNKQKAIAQLFATCDKNAIQNRLLQNYIDIITDTVNYANARGSIDVITAKIKKDLLPFLQKSEMKYKESGEELTPTYQLKRKMEFTTGKSGIGPFALNITNMALTQFAHITMKYTASVKDFDFGDLDAITGKDNLFISDWLSAMVNAHVDVAKDPYIFDMNINSATYEYVNFLLRAGKGMSTFTFIGQPAIKKLANLIQNSKSMYGGNIRSRKRGQQSGKNDPYDQVMSYYLSLLKNSLGNIDKEIKDEKQKSYIKAVAVELLKKVKDEESDNKQSKTSISYTDIFDEEYAKQMLNQPDTILYYIHQIKCLKAWKKIKPYADEISKLVTISRVDTEKFGNNIASQYNYLNDYNTFKYAKHAVTWYIKPQDRRLTDKEIKEQLEKFGSNYAIRKYLGDTFLDDKLYKATKLTRDILRNQLLTATPNFEYIFKHFLGSINGTVENLNNELLYNKVYKDEAILTISSAIDNIMRYKILAQSKVVKYNSDDFDYENKIYAGPIDFTCGGNVDVVNDQIYRLVFGDPEGKTDYDSHSIFSNVALLIEKLQNPVNTEEEELGRKSGLVDRDGNITNEMLNFLRPQTESDKFPIGRMLLAKSSFGISKQEESSLVSAFNELLENPVDEVRKLARDLVFYSYYSTYDQNGPQSFFNLVPAYYRQQYDRALKDALMKNNKDLNNILLPTDGRSVSEDFIDIICRNYWYDDNIVPVKNVKESKSSMSDGGSTITLVKANDVQKSLAGFKKQVHRKVDGLIIGQYIGSSPYIKVQRGRDYYLYKRIGFITRGTKEQYDVFAIVPKLGVHEGSIHQYEFSRSNGRVSIFEKNDLPSAFKLDNLLYNLNNYIDNQNKLAEAASKNKKQEFTPFIFNQLDNISLQFNGYKESDNNSSEYNGIEYNEDGKLKFVYVKDVQEELSKYKYDENVKAKQQQFLFDLSKDFDEQFKEFEKIINKDLSYTIAVTGSLKSPNVSEKEVKNKIDQLCEDYKNDQLKNDNNINTEQLDNLVQQYKESIVYDDVYKYVVQSKINAILEKYLLKISNVANINSIYSDGKIGVGEAVARFVQQHSSEITSGQPGYVIVDQRNLKEEYREQLNNFIDRFGSGVLYEFLSEEQKQDLNDLKDVFDRIDSVQDSIDDDNEKQLSNQIDTVQENEDTIGDTDPDEAQSFSLTNLFGLKKNNDTPVITQESEQKDPEDDNSAINKC